MGNNVVLGGGGFHHVSISVMDFDASVKFYTEVLGFKQTAVWGNDDRKATMLDSGDGCCIEIFGGETSAPKPEGYFTHIALRAANTGSVIERAKAAGIEVTKEPLDISIPSSPSIDAKIAFIKGPDGESIEIFQVK